MFESEQELEEYVLDFIEKNPEDKEGTVALGKTRARFGYFVKYYFDDSKNRLLQELKNAVQQFHTGTNKLQIEGN